MYKKNEHCSFFYCAVVSEGSIVVSGWVGSVFGVVSGVVSSGVEGSVVSGVVSSGVSTFIVPRR